MILFSHVIWCITAWISWIGLSRVSDLSPLCSWESTLFLFSYARLLGLRISRGAVEVTPRLHSDQQTKQYSYTLFLMSDTTHLACNALCRTFRIADPPQTICCWCKALLFLQNRWSLSSFDTSSRPISWMGQNIANSKWITHSVSTIATSVSCEYAIDGYKLQWSNCTRDLGVHMDTELKFTQHISIIVHIGHSRAALI